MIGLGMECAQFINPLGQIVMKNEFGQKTGFLFLGFSKGRAGNGFHGDCAIRNDLIVPDGI